MEFVGIGVLPQVDHGEVAPIGMDVVVLMACGAQIVATSEEGTRGTGPEPGVIALSKLIIADPIPLMFLLRR